jgi:hypothetical protein
MLVDLVFETPASSGPTALLALRPTLAHEETRFTGEVASAISPPKRVMPGLRLLTSSRQGCSRRLQGALALCQCAARRLRLL